MIQELIEVTEKALKEAIECHKLHNTTDSLELLASATQAYKDALKIQWMEKNNR